MTASLAFALFCGLACVMGLGQAFALLLGADIRLRTIKRGEGESYLERWTLGEQSDARRAADEASGAWRVRLHHFVAPDNAGHHNHPFRWAFSLVLWGSYDEEIMTPGRCEWHKEHERKSPGYPEFDFCLGGSCELIRTRRVRFFNWIPAEKYHRIVKLRGDVWTLFITGPRVQGWGFWVPGRGNVPWKQYKAERGESVEE